MSQPHAKPAKNDPDIVETLTFDQFIDEPLLQSSSDSTKPSTSPTPPSLSDDKVEDDDDVGSPEPAQQTGELASDVSDGATAASLTERVPASRSRLYLMVMADFGLSFIWLCKFAVATYVT